MKLSLIFLSVVSFSAFADVTEKVDGIEINYSQMKARFVGKSTWVKEDGPVLKAAEQRAWSDGINAAVKGLPKILSDRSASTEQDAWKASGFQAKDTISVKTVFAGDDTVTVLLENSFDQGMGRNNKAAAEDKVLMVSLNSRVNPRLNYVISDEAGSVISRSSTEDAAGVQKMFKNRWFKKGEKAAAVAFAGGERPSVSGRVSESGKVALSRMEWNEAVSKLGGEPDRIVFLIP